VSTLCAHVGSRRRSAVIGNNISDIAIARGVHRCVVVRRMSSHTTVVTHTTLGTPSAKYVREVEEWYFLLADNKNTTPCATPSGIRVSEYGRIRPFFYGIVSILRWSRVAPKGNTTGVVFPE
jgi:hypothetical protein